MATEHTNTFEEKGDKINNIKCRLHHMWSFLVGYLPLANSQGSEFLVNDLWEKMVPKNIQDELLLMSDAELSSLPSRKLIPLQDDKSDDMLENLDVIIGDHGDVDQCADYMFPGQSEFSTCSKENLKHPSLQSFIIDAQKNTLDSCHILTNISDLHIVFGFEKFEERFTGLLMSQKKSHEVDVMAELCSQLAKSFNTNLTVDLGSGKGYLSTQLCYQFNHCVVGIDASHTNTDGANKRAGRLGKELNVKAKSAKSHISKGNIVELKREVSSKIGEGVTSLLKQTSQSIQEKETGTCDCGYDIVTCGMEELVDSLGNVTVNTNSPLKITCLDGGNHGNAISCSLKQHCDCVSSANSLEKIHKLQDITSIVSRHSKNNALECHGSKDEPETCNSPDIQISVRKRTELDDVDKTDTKWNDRFVPLTKYVDCNMKLLDSIKDALTQLNLDMVNPSILLTGLHTCGGLGSSILRLFVNSPSATVLCNVSCCYNLMEEEFVVNSYGDKTDGSQTAFDFPMSDYLRKRGVGLGKAARNIGCLAVHRMSAEQQLQGQSFYPRALLQKIVKDLIGEFEWEGHRLRKIDKKSQSLYDYINKCFTKLGLPTDQVTPELVEDYDKTYSHVRHQMSAFVQLRAVLAPCIESFILLDRYLYLLEQETVKEVYITRLFDPVISPRCYAIIATKNTM